MKKVLLVLVGLIVVLVVVALFMPSKWHAERSVTMKASADVVYAAVADLKQWESWTVWNKQADPSATWQFSGSPMGPGAAMSWKGDKMRTGSVAITKGDPKTGIAYDVKMDRMQATGNIAFAPDGSNTKVTWTADGDVGLFLPARFMVGSIEKMMGDDFQRGLENLKLTAEKAQAAADEAAARAAVEKAKAEAEAAAAEAAAAEAAAAEAAKKAPKGKKAN